MFRKSDFGDAVVGIGSVKSNIGHLLGAAGGAGLAKLLLCLQHEQMAPNLHLETVNPLLQLEDTPFQVITEPTPWPRVAERPRQGAITSLGLGGTNVHVVVEEGDPERRGTELSCPVVCLSAQDEDALHRMLDDLSAQLANGDIDRYNLAMTLVRFRPAYDWRATVRFDPTSGTLGEVGVTHVERPVRRVLVRPTPTSRAREEWLRDGTGLAPAGLRRRAGPRRAGRVTRRRGRSSPDVGARSRAVAAGDRGRPVRRRSRRGLGALLPRRDRNRPHPDALSALQEAVLALSRKRKP